MNPNTFREQCPRAFLLCLAACLALCALCATGRAAQDTAMQTVHINADSALYSLEDEIITIEGNVSIRYGDLQVKGLRLVYSNTTHIAALSGSPVTLTRGKTTTATAGRIEVDLDHGKAKAWDGVSVTHNDGPVSATFQCEHLDLDYENGEATARVGVDMTYRNRDREKAFKDNGGGGEPDGPAGDLQAMNVAVSPAHITAGHMHYNFETGAMRAGEVVRVELPELTLDASDVRGNLEDKRLEAAGGIRANMDDMSARAGRASVDYGKREAVFEQGVRAQRGADVMTGERVIMDYTPGRRTVRVKGPVDIQLEIPQDTMDDGGGDSAPR